MTVMAAEKKERKKIRLTISSILKQSCEDCPIAKSKSKKTLSIHCCTKCPMGQKLKKLGSQLIVTDTNEELWTEEEDFYLVKNYAFYTTKHLAEKLGKSVDEIWSRYKYLLSQAELTRGSEYDDFRS